MALDFTFKELIFQAKDIFISPWLHPQALWMILPLILILLLIHLYFGRNRSESLGWNSAFGNSISLLWVCVLLSKFLIENHGLNAILYQNNVRTNAILILILSFWVILLIIINFFHIISKRITFIISSTDTVYILSYILISLIITEKPLNTKTLLASFFLFITMILLLQLIKFLIPMSKEAKLILKKREAKNKKKNAIKKATRTRKIHKYFKKIKAILT